MEADFVNDGGASLRQGVGAVSDGEGARDAAGYIVDAKIASHADDA